MRFVPIKSVEQQGQLLVHRACQGFVEQRTATFNRIRGLLAELGIVLPLKAAVVRREALARLEELPGWINTVIGEVSRLARPGHTTAKLDLRRAMLDWLKGIKGEKSSQGRLKNGAPGARLSSGSAADRCSTNDRL